MGLIISFILSVIINFSVPPIPESKRSITKKSYVDYVERGFPFNYYQGEKFKGVTTLLLE